MHKNPFVSITPQFFFHANQRIKSLFPLIHSRLIIIIMKSYLGNNSSMHRCTGTMTTRRRRWKHTHPYSTRCPNIECMHSSSLLLYITSHHINASNSLNPLKQRGKSTVQFPVKQYLCISSSHHITFFTAKLCNMFLEFSVYLTIHISRSC